MVVTKTGRTISSLFKLRNGSCIIDSGGIIFHVLLWNTQLDDQYMTSSKSTVWYNCQCDLKYSQFPDFIVPGNKLLIANDDMQNYKNVLYITNVLSIIFTINDNTFRTYTNITVYVLNIIPERRSPYFWFICRVAPFSFWRPPRPSVRIQKRTTSSILSSPTRSKHILLCNRDILYYLSDIRFSWFLTNCLDKA